MYFHKALLALFGAFILNSCSVGLSGGSIEKAFSGIKGVTVLGPETVEITWDTNGGCNSYKIYRLSSSSSSDVGVATIPPARLTAPTVESDRAYTFAVGCVTNKEITGLSYTQSVTTWPKFNGLVNSTLDTTGVAPVIVLSWTPPSTSNIAFEIYAKQSSVPGDLSTWQLTQTGGAGGAYSETPLCTVFGNSARLGTGGDCSSSSLQAGQIYNFKVVARYLDNKHSDDIMGNGTSILIPSTFTPPNCILTQSGLGADATSSYLFLRCENSGSGSCLLSSMSIRAYQAINGVRTAVSDTLVGAGTLRIEPQISTSQANDRSVENLEIEYTCNSTSPATKALIRYDGTQLAYPKPSLKYANSGYELAPAKSAEQHPSHAGQAMAIGDFNCDGKPDMAVGYPQVTYAQAPYYSKNTETGVVKIYYGYAQDTTGTITSNDIQYLSFRDLSSFAHFGQSVSAGNINRDVHLDTNNNKLYSCDDLIIGAPGVSGQSTTAEAFIFYGHPQKFPQPLDSTSLAVNAPTCTGILTNQVCSPVMLKSTSQTTLSLSPTFSIETSTSTASSLSEFGFSVAFIRDFNADGFGDVAIGDPYCDWDGEAINGFGVTIGNTLNKLEDVGCVYVYWGGPNGLQNVNVGKSPDNLRDMTVPYVKVFSPIPQPYAHFGWSIAGGGDVDGGLPVPVLQNGTQDAIIAPGNDFVVGAPDFSYNQTSQLAGMVGKGQTTAWSAGSDTPDPIVRQGPPGFSDVASPKVESDKVTPPWNGAWAPQTAGSNPWANTISHPVPSNAALANSTGIAVLYKGRSAHKSFDFTFKSGAALYPNLVTNSPLTNPIETLLSWSARDHQNGSQFIKYVGTPDWTVAPVQSFYNCGSRGAPTGADSNGYFKHYSCLAGRNNFSLIYPILKAGDSAVSKFGSTVAIAGPKDQNAVALYQLGAFVSASSFSRDASDNFVPNAQGNTHTQIRGTSTWEIGIPGFNTFGSANAGCERFNDQTNSTFNSGSCAGYLARMGRSPLSQQHSFSASSGFNSPQPDAPIDLDINRDGYADIVVGTAASGNSASIYTYFGNFAADFSYSKTGTFADTYSTAGSCNVTRLSTGVSADTTGYYSTISLIANPSPYSTFWVKSAVTNVSSTKADWIMAEYPQFQLPNTGFYQRLSYLEDVTSNSSAGGFNYAYGDIVRTSNYASNCLVQRRTYPSAPSSITMADMNADHVVDGIIGFQSDNNNTGKGVISYAAQFGNGLIADTNFTNGTAPSSLAGYAVAGSDWKFIDESTRRDFILGAPGYASGAGLILDYNASGSNVINGVPAGTITENSNAPNQLGAQYSRIMGDLNGDGFDDIWVPVRRTAADGSTYYDAIVYYGSNFGPVTTQACRARLSMFKTSSGASLSSTDCEATSGGATAMVGQTQVRLPQYIGKPTGVDWNWAISALPAGDVDHDGKSEVIVFSPSYGGGEVYLFFGSDSGFVNGQPILGPSTNHVPQKISGNGTVVSSYRPSPVGTYFDSVNQAAVSSVQPTFVGAYNFVHGDFNADGYEDIVINQAGAQSPRYAGTWTCTTGTASSIAYTPYCGQVSPPIAPQNPGPAAQVAGQTLILYGGPNGIQSPITAGGVASDFESTDGVCNDFYQTCTYDATSTTTSGTWREVYRTLRYNAPNWEVDTSNTACDPSTGTCKGQIIRNPIFFNDAIGGDMFLAMNSTKFGEVMTVADANNDGIDDLIIGVPNFSHLNYGTASATQYNNGTILGGTSPDAGQKGTVMIFYGAKGAGLVAPAPQSYLTDSALGVSTGAVTPMTNTPIFALYPHPANAAQPSTVPELDRDNLGNPIQSIRQFGINMSPGDFNGDGVDDIAVTSARGQVYVYYGPLCSIDNTKNAWQNYTYQNHNLAKSVTGYSATDCTVLNFNAALSTGGWQTVGSVVPAASKPLFPQMLYVSGITSTNHFGSVLLSQRPKRGLASTVVISNPGNINGDPERTSDLVIATNDANDPNATLLTYKKTGLGYVFFGHKTPSSGEMPSLPGLFIGNASYNSSIVASVQGGQTYYFYTPMLLRPHMPDSSVGTFFQFYTTFGDMNGDGRMDLMMPTNDLHEAVDGTPVVYGGGFKLFY